MNVLVVPTNRPQSLPTFLEAWEPWPWDHIVIVEDGPERTVTPPRRSGSCDVEVVSWRDIDASLATPGIISRADSAIRSFGFWRAWASGADVIFTLDDDCYPDKGSTGQEHLERHLDNLFRTPKWDSTVAGLRVRGLPYRNLGILDDVALSMGLWTGTPDVDAVQTLAAGPSPVPGIDGAVAARVMPADQYFPLSGMNLAFRREITSLMYFAPMGQGQPYGRFDDIWCGLVVQRICRHLRRPIVTGAPVVEHQRASDPFVNLVREAAGIRTNEQLWERVDRLVLSAGTPLACTVEVAEQLASDGEPYMARWGESLLGWCSLFATT